MSAENEELKKLNAEFRFLPTFPNGMPKTAFMQWLIEQCDAGNSPARGGEGTSEEPPRVGLRRP